MATDSEQPSQPEFKYWGFISYSHADEDWARWLHQRLETYRVPRRLVGKPGREGVIPERAYPIFRDRDELPGSAKLTDSIEWALQQSRYLIVLCSPRAAESKWVDQEIRIFKSLGREDRVLCLIIDGEPNAAIKPQLGLAECFPEAIRYWVDADRRITEVPTEPIAADARKGKDGRENAVLKLLSGILGVPYDDLRQRAHERRQRRLQYLSTGALALSIVFFILGVEFYFQRNAAVEAKRYAESQEKAANAARDETRKAYEQEKEAKEKEIQAKLAEQEARKQAEAAAKEERIAKEKETKAKEEETVAHKQADVARNDAIEARHLAEDRELKALRILSTSDLTAATRLIEENSAGKALAYLARAMRYDPANASVVSRMVSLLSQRNWPLPVEPLQHASEVKSASFSPDGKLLATISGNSAWLWDAASHKNLFELKHKGQINFAEFSSNGKLFVTAARDNTAQIWDTADGQTIGAPLSHDSWVNCASFSRDGKFVATGTLNKTVHLWEIATGKAAMRPVLFEGTVRSLSFNPAGNWLLVAAKNSAQIWDIAKQDRVGAPMNHEGGVYSAAFSPSGKFVATASGDKTARIWDAASGQPTADPLKHDNWVNTVRFSPDEKWIVTASSDNTARVFEVPRGKAVLSLRHDGEVFSASFSPNTRWIVTASADSTALVWDTLNGKPTIEPLRHSGPVYDAEFSPDGKTVATASADHTAKIWDVINGRPIFEPLKHSQPISLAIFSPDSKRVATASADRTARIWEVGSGQPITEPLKHDGAVLALKFSADGKILFTGSEDGTARAWNTETSQPIFAPLKHGSWVNVVALSPNEKWIATASEDRTARIWDAATGQPITESLQHTGVVKSAVFSSDGKSLLTTSLEKNIRIWDVASGKVAATLQRPDAYSSSDITAAALSPDGKWVATALADKAILIWNAATGDVIGQPILTEAPVQLLTFAPASSWEKKKWLLTAADKFARIWDIDTGTAVTEPIKNSDPIQAASFSPDGNFFVTAFGTNARIWEAASGKPISDLLQHQGKILSANFNADGSLLVTSSADQTARVWFVALHGKAPAWLDNLADAVGGYRLDDSGAAQLLADSSEHLNSARALLASAAPDPFVIWAKWFSADRSSRAASPVAPASIGDYVRRRVAEGTETALQEVLEFQPNNGLALARLALISRFPAQAEFFSRFGANCDPQNPEVLWRRASILQEQNKFADALAMMEQALALDPHNNVSFGPEGAEFVSDYKNGVIAKGWIPKGWFDRSSGLSLNVSYTNLPDPPQPNLTALELSATSPLPSLAELSGPRFICKKGVRCTVEGWVRSASKSELNVVLVQFIEPHQNYFQQTIHTTPEWKPFKIQFNPPQDLAAEIVIREPSGSTVQFGGIAIPHD